MTRDGEVGPVILYGDTYREYFEPRRRSEKDIMATQNDAHILNHNGFSQPDRRCSVRWVVYGLWVALATVMGIAMVRQSFRYHETCSIEVFHS
jgi:hypothetical protein